MEWNNLITSLTNSGAVILVLAYAWRREAQRADAESNKRDADNKTWADRYAELAHAKGFMPEPIDSDKRLP